VPIIIGACKAVKGAFWLAILSMKLIPYFLTLSISPPGSPVKGILAGYIINEVNSLFF
jgi:hypothetical protein